jgi:hypothetical protein
MDLCEIRNKLLNEWSDATTLYASLVASLVAQAGVTGKKDFRHLLKTVGIAADLADRTRKDFEVHIRTHTCSS